MGISIRAYARHRGVTDTAVHKAIRAGRISTEADGTIDPSRADEEWARNTESREAGTRGQAVRPTSPEGEGAPAGAVAGAGGASLLQARTVNEVVKAQTNKVRLARLKGELIDRSQAIAQVFRLARAERDAWLNWPARLAPQLAAQFGVDAHAMHVALETAVRAHLAELGEVRVRVD